MCELCNTRSQNTISCDNIKRIKCFQLQINHYFYLQNGKRVHQSGKCGFN